MLRKTLVVVSFVLAASMAQAQARPPKPPRAPLPPAAPATVGVGDLSELASLGADLADLASLQVGAELDLKLAPAIAGATSRALGSLNLAETLGDLDVWQTSTGQRTWSLSRLGEGESADYSRGTEYLDQGRYEQALQAFDKAIAANGKRVDGAMYWKAYSLSRLGRSVEAISTLDDLLKKFPSSRWANDARALQVEVKQASGRPVNPAQQGDEELKLIALNGLVSRDPDRGIPMVEQILAGAASPRMKERALFVLAQSGSPRAKTILTDIAKGKGNPDLQIKALDYLGVFGGGPDVPLLVDVYKSSPDIDVKRRVIRSLATAGRRGVFSFNFGPEMAIAQSFAMAAGRPAIAGEVSAEARAKVQEEMSRVQSEVLRAQAEAERARADADREASRVARSSGVTVARSAASSEREKAREAKAKEASDALWQLYQTETTPELKREILRNMYFGDQSDRLVQIARTEKDADLRRAALQAMMFSKTPKTADTLVGLYRDEKDPAVRRQIVDVLGAMSAAGPLVQIARQETDPQLRKSIVQRLSLMKEKEATDYMLEILKK
jgi:tetratricopeptide (TPR) repeat protein